MPELRRDPILSRWVIIATERAKRPSDFKQEEAGAPSAFCPFCEGNEGKTPPEIMACREEGTAPDTPGWRVRVVPNKFPALGIDGNLEKRGIGVYDRMRGVGAHEVIIETPKHERSLTGLDVGRVREVLAVYRDRMRDLKKDDRLHYGMLFKNVGVAAGASLEHTHSQLIVTPVVPRTPMQEMAGCKSFYDYRGRCLFCDMIYQEMDTEQRVVVSNDAFVAFAPYASRFPFEMWIVGKRHESHFEDIRDDEIDALSALLREALVRLERALPGAPYNYIVHTAPFNMSGIKHYHWHIEIIPRLTKVAGFEWGTGFYINPVPPESAAEFLREVEL